MPQYVTLSECGSKQGKTLLAKAEAIFFETSLTKTFSSDAERHRFSSRWFRNYAEAEPESFVFAVSGRDIVTAYLAGCVDSFSGKARQIIADIDYFKPEFCAALKDYPSHFHINVSPEEQGKGTGRLLTAKFKDISRVGGASGIHIVTGAASSAVPFYEACGFLRFPNGEAACGAGHAVMICPL